MFKLSLTIKLRSNASEYGYAYNTIACICVRVHVCMYAFNYVCPKLHVGVCTLLDIQYKCIYACMICILHVCLYAYKCIMYVYMTVCMYLCMHVYMYVCV